MEFYYARLFLCFKYSQWPKEGKSDQHAGARFLNGNPAVHRFKGQF